MFTPLLAVPYSCHVSTLVAIWNPCNMCTRQTCLYLPQWCGFVTTLTSPATSNKGLAVLRSLVVPTYVLAHAIVPVSPEKLRKMPLSGIEFLGAGILRITCDSGKCNTWGDIPWRSVPPNVLETFCHCNDWMCDEIHIEGYWRILRVTFKGAAVSLPTPFCWRISGCIASVKWVFF